MVLKPELLADCQKYASEKVKAETVSVSSIPLNNLRTAEDAHVSCRQRARILRGHSTLLLNCYEGN